MWALDKHSSKNNGFTIVELLIVIVVIGILAAIVIVAFNGVQDRARWTKLQGDLSAVNKAIQMSYAENGSYPTPAAAVGTWRWTYSCSVGTGDAFISGITSVASNLPQAPCNGGTSNDDTWIYGTDGTDYKLLHIRPNISTGVRNNIPANMQDPQGRWTSTSSTWGYWSPGAATR